MRISILLATLFCVSNSFAADIKYPVSAIPEKLLKGANVVKRMEEIHCEIVSLTEVIVKKKVAYTILNEEGSRFATMVLGYDKMNKIISFDGALYNAFGLLIQKLKSKDINDQSATSDGQMIMDSRVKFHTFSSVAYPYTVEYETEEKALHTFYFDSWHAHTSSSMSVEKSSCVFVAPAAYLLRYKTFNTKAAPSITEVNGKKIYSWKVDSLPAFKMPYASPQWRELTTAVIFAPSNFEVEGFKGNASNWLDYGKFQIELNKGRDVLPEGTVNKIAEITAGITDKKEKIKVLYEFMQKHTRYIGIQLGIGGWQPFEASFIATKGYGDCKGLSNYMYSILKTAGIKSHYTWVRAGREYFNGQMNEDLPSNQFNHIILCVPVEKDTMWLECTSQTSPAGYMGDFTGNRKVVIIADDGGKVVSTPRYGLNENTQLRKIAAKLTDDGTLNMDVQTAYRAIQQEDVSGMITHLSKEKVKERLNQKFRLATYDINEFSYTEKKSALPEVIEDLKITVPDYATITGKRIFILPNILNKNGDRLTLEDNRTVDYFFDMAWRDEDKVEIEIPAGYTVEAGMADASYKTKFGTYTTTLKLEGNKIMYHRTMEKFEGRFPASDGKEIVKFMEDVYKADRSRLVLVKQAPAP